MWSKLIAQTYDAAAVMASQDAGVQAKIREQYPNAVFVHCYVHRLHLVLAQSASFIEEVKAFFATLPGFRTSYAKSTKRLKHWIPTSGTDFLLPHLLYGNTTADCWNCA
jgi:hypothetical protein